MAERSRERRDGWWKTALRILVSAGLLAYVVALIDVRAVVAAAAGARVDLLLAMVAVAGVERVVAAWRWYILLEPGDPAIGFLPVLRLVLVSSFAGYAVPGTVGVEAVRVYGVARRTNVGHAVSSVLVERVLALFALLLLVMLALLLAPGTPGVPVGGIVGLGMVGILVGWLVVMRPGPRRWTLALLPGRRLAPLREKIRETHGALDGYRRQPRLVWVSLAAAVPFQLLRVVMAAIGAWALGAETGLVAFLLVVPVVGLLTVLPITVGGLGVQEVGFVYMLGRAGMAPESALALSLLLHLMVLVAIIPGAWLYWRRGLTL